MGHAVTQLVEALLYKPEGRGFSLLTQMITREVSCGEEGRSVCSADNLAIFMC